VSKRYLKIGEVVGVEKAGDHLGIQHYGYGEVFPLPNQKANDPLYLTKFSMPEKKIYVSKGNYFLQKKIFLRECNYSEETSFSEPIKGVLKIGESEFEDCWIYPKNLSCAVVELEAPHAILEGDIVTILKKKGKNSKVYLTGKVKYIVEDKPIIEQGIERVKADYANDF
jgi:tRNA U34 2-thiouridine synthase MnmA/TrmU